MNRFLYISICLIGIVGTIILSGDDEYNKRLQYTNGAILECDGKIISLSNTVFEEGYFIGPSLIGQSIRLKDCIIKR